MEIYKTIKEYSLLKWIHEQSGKKRFTTWRLIKLTKDNKKLGYIDRVEIVKEFIKEI